MSDTDEITRLRAENERLREWNAEIALNARELVAENERLRAALGSPSTVHINMLRGVIAKPTLAQIIHVYGEDALRAAIAAQHAPSGWRLDELIMAANAIIDFYNGPVEAKRPDIFQRLMQRLANALPPEAGKEEA